MSDPRKETFLIHLLQATPPGRNPFIDGVQALGRHSFPHVPAYSYRVLIFFMVVYGAITLGALFLILFPLLKGPEMRKKHLWLWNKCYIGSPDTTPFYVPNNSLSVAVCQFLTSVLFLVYLVLHYTSFRSLEFARSSHIVIWLDVALLPGFIGFWITGVNSLYTCLCSPYRDFEEPKKFMRWLKFFTSPAVLNVFCILVPLLVTLKTIYWTVAQSVATERVWNHHDIVAKLFHQAAKEWSPNVAVDPSSEAMQELERVVKRHITLLRVIGRNVRLASIQWNVCIFVLSAFYFLTTGALILLVRRSLKIASGKLSVLKGERPSETAHSRPESETKSDIDSDIMVDQGSTAAAHLQRGYMHLTIQCIFLSLCLLFDLSTSVFFTTHVNLIMKSGEVRASTVWVSRIGSVFMAVAMLLRSWRIYNTKDLHQQSQEYTMMCISPQEPAKQSDRFGATLRNCPTTDASSESADRYCEPSLEISHVARQRWIDDDVNERTESSQEGNFWAPPHQTSSDDSISVTENGR